MFLLFIEAKRKNLPLRFFGVVRKVLSAIIPLNFTDLT